MNTKNSPDESTGNKIGYFLRGFLLNILLAAIFFALYWLLVWGFSTIGLSQSKDTPMIIVIIAVGTMFVTEFILIKHYFKTRRYIAIGMLVTLIAPLLVSGFCSSIMLSYNF